MQSNLYRFRGVRALYGEEAFKNFQKSHVLIVGTGGVGSWAIECLVRTGIGEITIIDNDISSLTEDQIKHLQAVGDIALTDLFDADTVAMIENNPVLHEAITGWLDNLE